MDFMNFWPCSRIIRRGREMKLYWGRWQAPGKHIPARRSHPPPGPGRVFPAGNEVSCGWAQCIQQKKGDHSIYLLLLFGWLRSSIEHHPLQGEKKAKCRSSGKGKNMMIFYTVIIQVKSSWIQGTKRAWMHGCYMAGGLGRKCRSKTIH